MTASLNVTVKSTVPPLVATDADAGDARRRPARPCRSCTSGRGEVAVARAGAAQRVGLGGVGQDVADGVVVDQVQAERPLAAEAVHRDGVGRAGPGDRHGPGRDRARADDLEVARIDAGDRLAEVDLELNGAGVGQRRAQPGDRR